MVKMASISQRPHLQVHLMNEKLGILIQISVQFFSKGLIDNIEALVQVMAWRRTGDKPVPEPVLIQFTDAYMRHKGRWVNISNHKQNILYTPWCNGNQDCL